MKSDKSDKTPATSATSATNDPLALVGLGIGASQRAKDLALKGLEYEKRQNLHRVLSNAKPL